ncbi:MAG: hypothetical protein ABI574_13750 [Burkholderiales bacterium]
MTITNAHAPVQRTALVLLRHTLPAMPAAKSAIQADSSATLFKSAKAFETWLKKHHATSDGLWLKIARRIAQLVAMLARGETIHIFKPRAKA